MLLRPTSRLIVPFAGLLLMAELPMRHGHKQPIDGVPTFAQLHRPLEGFERLLPVADAVVGYPQGVPEVAVIRCEGDGLRRQLQPSLLAPALCIRRGDQNPGKEVARQRAAETSRPRFAGIRELYLKE